MKEFYKALAAAKEVANASLTKKLGRNTFSKYDYFLPSQISNAVRAACKETGLVTMFTMTQHIDGRVEGFLEVIHIESAEGKVYNLPTAIPDIKATNAAQKIGGSITYAKRYLETAVFDIAEDDKDPDATHNGSVPKPVKPKPKPVKKIVPADKFPAVLAWAIKEKVTLAEVEKSYDLTPVQKEQLELKIK